MTTTDFGEVLSEWMALFLESSKIRWQRCSFLLNRAKSFCGRSQDGRANSQTPKSLLLVAQILIFLSGWDIHCLLLDSSAWATLVEFPWLSIFWWGKTQLFFDYRLVELIDVHFSCLLSSYQCVIHKWPIYIYICMYLTLPCLFEFVFIEGSLEVKLPTIWTDEKQSREEAQRRERLEERRVEEKESEERRCRCAKR